MNSSIPSLLAAISLLLPSAMLADAQDSRVLQGQVYSADGRGVIGLRAFIRGAGGDTALVDVAGDFELRISDRSGPIELAIDAEQQGPREYHPVLAGIDSLDLADGVRVVLIPLEWPITAGTFAGQTVSISMDRAYKPACTGCPSFYRQGTPRPPHNRRVNPESWPAAAFPLRIAFDRDHSRARIAPRDSIRFWNAVESLESDFGEKLFRPIPYSASMGEDGEDVGDVILVSIESMNGQGYGSSVSQNGDIFYGAVRIRSIPLLGSPEGHRLVMHELMHTLGIGHTCGWRSAMAQARVCGAAASTTLSAEDVAYTQVLMRVRELQKAYGARIGIEGALAGERHLGMARFGTAG